MLVKTTNLADNTSIMLRDNSPESGDLIPRSPEAVLAGIVAAQRELIAMMLETICHIDDVDLAGSALLGVGQMIVALDELDELVDES